MSFRAEASAWTTTSSCRSPAIFGTSVKRSGSQVVAKFTFDILASAALLIVFSPLILGIALAIKLDSRGPVLFRQRRVGLRGRSFTMLKFRTMRDGADREVEQLRTEMGV